MDSSSINNETMMNDDTNNMTNADDYGATAEPTNEKDAFQWTAATIIQSIALFGAAGVAEILGGWMVWMALRGNSSGKKPWWFGVLGSLVLILYGIIPCFQPTDNFGRIYAVYGGFFILLSFLFGWVLDGNRPDLGDLVGGAISVAGVLLILFWPRNDNH